MRQGSLLTLIHKLNLQIRFEHKGPEESQPAKTDDALAKGDLDLVAALAARVLLILLEGRKDHVDQAHMEDAMIDRRALMEAIVALFTDDMVPRSIQRFCFEPRCPSMTADDIEALSFDCGEYLRSQDASTGGGAVCDVAIAMYQHVTAWLEKDSHPTDMTRALDPNLAII